MTAQIIYGHDFKAKAEKEREDPTPDQIAYMHELAAEWRANRAVPVYVAPETDPA